MNILYLDLETYGTTPIKRGLYRYSEDAHIMLFAYALNDGPVEVVDLTICNVVHKIGQIKGLIALSDVIVAHNSAFDRVMLEQEGFIGANDPRWCDTMVRALMHSLPGGLADLCAIYRLPIDKAKDKRGKELIRLFCVPNKQGKRTLPADRPAQWAEFVDYAAQDVVAMRELWRLLPDWNKEWDLWRIDQVINDRGIYVDTVLARAAIEACNNEQDTRSADMSEATGGDVTAVTQRDKLARHISSAFGITFPDLKKSTIERRLADEDLPEEVRELLRLRLLGSKSSVTKYRTLIDSAGSDSRLRGTLQFCGAARTGRDSGRLFQPQNLPRPKLKQAAIDSAIEWFRMGKGHLLSMVYESITGVASDCIRGAICAPPGAKVVAADLSNIEGRVLAWIAGEDWKLRAYGAGEDLYIKTYAKSFSAPEASVSDDQRQLGKVLELSMGYGGGVGALVTFALGFGIDLDALACQLRDKIPVEVKAKASAYYSKAPKHYGLSKPTFIACDSLKRMWRAANPKIEQLWYEAEGAVRRVLSGSPIEHVKLGHAVIKIDRKGPWLRCQLPSGRYMCYPSARIVDGSIVYRGVNQYTRKWGDIKSYGGKLVENWVQAISRDIFMHGVELAEYQGLPIVMRVHDEIVAEVALGRKGADKLLCACMEAKPKDWAADMSKLPLGAKGYEALRYKK